MNLYGIVLVRVNIFLQGSQASLVHPSKNAGLKMKVFEWLIWKYILLGFTVHGLVSVP